MPEILTLSGDDVHAALPMSDAIDAMRTAFTVLHAGKAQIPQRISLRGGDGAVTLVMPGVTPTTYGLGAKLVSVVPKNPEAGHPLVSGALLLLDRETGMPAALLEAEALTAIRTGAASGLATDLLALPSAHKLGMLGAGRQAREQVAGVCAVREISEVRVWSRSSQRAEAFAAELRDEAWAPSNVSVHQDPSTAVVGADVVCTATPARFPLLVGAHGWPGLHVNAVGSFTPEMREIEADLMAAARVVVDQKEAALAEAGEIAEAIAVGAMGPDEIVELGAVLRGKVEGRTSSDDITIFKSVGLAVQDLVAGSVAVETARARGLGTPVTL
jgi:ornithine cyclodeaminase